jgi:hypothetical protein
LEGAAGVQCKLRRKRSGQGEPKPAGHRRERSLGAAQWLLRWKSNRPAAKSSSP